MKNSHLLIVMKEANLSPEEFSRRIDVSNMTLRRWLEKPAGHKIPELYVHEFRRAVYELIGEKRLDADSPTVRSILMSEDFRSANAAIKSLGLPGGLFKGDLSASEDNVATGLATIGASEKRIARVQKDMRHILSFKKFSKQWAERIRFLTRFIRDRKITASKKFVAYGSLFYLIYPFDLLPDFMPAVGYLDDFAMLGIAVGFLTKVTKK